MMTSQVQIVDQNKQLVATAQVAADNDFYEGAIDMSTMPSALRRLFDEYEEIVNSQMFGLLDDVEKKIEMASLKIVSEDGDELPVKDLQIFPGNGRVSFKVARRKVKQETSK